MLVVELLVELELIALAHGQILAAVHTYVWKQPSLFDLGSEAFEGDEDVVRLDEEEGVDDAADFRGNFVERAVFDCVFWERYHVL